MMTVEVFTRPGTFTPVQREQLGQALPPSTPWCRVFHALLG